MVAAFQEHSLDINHCTRERGSCLTLQDCEVASFFFLDFTSVLTEDRKVTLSDLGNKTSKL